MLKSIEEVIVTLEMNVWPQVVELQWMHIVSSLHILNILTTNTILMKKHPIKYKLLLKWMIIIDMKIKEIKEITTSQIYVNLQIVIYKYINKYTKIVVDIKIFKSMIVNF